MTCVFNHSTADSLQTCWLWTVWLVFQLHYLEVITSACIAWWLSIAVLGMSAKYSKASLFGCSLILDWDNCCEWLLSVLMFSHWLLCRTSDDNSSWLRNECSCLPRFACGSPLDWNLAGRIAIKSHNSRHRCYEHEYIVVQVKSAEQLHYEWWSDLNEFGPSDLLSWHFMTSFHTSLITEMCMKIS